MINLSFLVKRGWGQSGTQIYVLLLGKWGRAESFPVPTSSQLPLAQNNQYAKVA